MVKFAIIVKIRAILLNAALKKKGIHSLNQECRDNTAQDDFTNDGDKFFIGTINVQNSNPSDSGDINLKNTNNQNFLSV